MPYYEVTIVRTVVQKTTVHVFVAKNTFSATNMEDAQQVAFGREVHADDWETITEQSRVIQAVREEQDE